MSYQDRIVRGEIVARGFAECESRYEDVVRPAISEFASRPSFTVMDLGANEGFFSLRIAEDFPNAVVVAIDKNDEHVTASRESEMSNVLAIQSEISGKMLRDLARCERVEVVIAFNLLHWLKDWADAVEALLLLAERTLIQTPARGNKSVHPERHGPIIEHIEATTGAAMIADVPSWRPDERCPVFSIDRSPKPLESAYLGSRWPIRKHRIDTTTQAKSIVYSGGEAREWLPGINLQTFLALGGGYPTREQVASAAERELSPVSAGAKRHGNVHVGNLIISGRDRLSLIDWDDQRNVRNDSSTIERALALIRTAGPREILREAG